MKQKLFRDKSIERVSSPEQLDDYIKVSNPGIWMVLAAILALLVGICVWATVGSLDTVVTVAAVAENGAVTCYVREADIASVKAEDLVRVNDAEGKVGEIATKPISATENLEEYALYVGGIEQGEWVYPVRTEADVPDGVYKAEIVVDSVSPMSFIMN